MCKAVWGAGGGSRAGFACGKLGYRCTGEKRRWSDGEVGGVTLLFSGFVVARTR